MSAVCSIHSDRVATMACAACASPICDQCAVSVAGRPVCATCAQSGRPPAAAPYPSVSASAIPMSVPRTVAPFNAPRASPPQAADQTQAYTPPAGMIRPTQPSGRPISSGEQTSPLRAKPKRESASGPNIGRGALVGILLGVLFGVIFGLASVATNLRIGLINILSGFAIGYAVRAASGEGGETQGMIAGLCSLGACLLGQYIMYAAYISSPGGMHGDTNFFVVTTQFSPLNWVFMVFAFWRGYRIAAAD